MTTTHGDNATTWRDLTDKLTSRQVAELDQWERRYGHEVPDGYAEWLLNEARDSIETNKRDAELSARIQLPAGATSIGGWDSLDKAGRVCRSIQWATFGAGATAVDIDGWQDETGAVDGPRLSVYGLEDGEKLTAADGRLLAEALTRAADRLDQLTT